MRLRAAWELSVETLRRWGIDSRERHQIGQVVDEQWT